MNIFCDTRQQKNKHKNIDNRLEELGHNLVRTKLYVGDYWCDDAPKIYVDTKKDWVEVASNICGKQHTRFREECEKAQSLGAKLFILVEQNMPPYAFVSSTRNNGSPLTKVSGNTLAKAIATMQERYAVQFLWCSKNQTADMIVELIKGEAENE
jgi:ERCC4-type nuclease